MGVTTWCGTLRPPSIWVTSIRSARRPLFLTLILYDELADGRILQYCTMTNLLRARQPGTKPADPSRPDEGEKP
ncbi:MAG TPA: hypothetical protein VES02_18210 [Dermatophilaceae bacterium]|nr:hypothetical protein [Dermatophilaceae bacterium]